MKKTKDTKRREAAERQLLYNRFVTDLLSKSSPDVATFYFTNVLSQSQRQRILSDPSFDGAQWLRPFRQNGATP